MITDILIIDGHGFLEYSDIMRIKNIMVYYVYTVLVMNYLMLYFY